MSTLSEYIKSQPDRPMREWASEFGISRPYLIALMAGDRSPSLDVAIAIQDATGGDVPIEAWPNIRRLLDGARRATS